jgi:hypothetical protein
MLRDMIGDYDSLPDTYTLADYDEATSGFDVRGVIWSDAGAADPVAAAEWVASQNTAGRVIGLVALGDPTDPGSGSFPPSSRARRPQPPTRTSGWPTPSDSWPTRN